MKIIQVIASSKPLNERQILFDEFSLRYFASPVGDIYKWWGDLGRIFNPDPKPIPGQPNRLHG